MNANKRCKIAFGYIRRKIFQYIFDFSFRTMRTTLNRRAERNVYGCKVRNVRRPGAYMMSLLYSFRKFSYLCLPLNIECNESIP